MAQQCDAYITGDNLAIWQVLLFNVVLLDSFDYQNPPYTELLSSHNNRENSQFFS